MQKGRRLSNTLAAMQGRT